MAGGCSLLPRRPCRFGGARRPRAWCRRRPAALAAPRRAALVTSRALRGVFWHVSACQRRQQARLPCLRPRACGRARQARRSSARVFDLAAGDKPAWLVARREPVQYALGMLYSIANSLGRSAGPGREVSGVMARSEYHAYELYDRAAGGGLAQRAARRQAAPHPSNSICYLAALAATASGGLRRPPRFASAAYDCGTHVGSPPASPAAGPHSAPLVGGVPRRLRSTGCLAQTAADAARGRCRRCCRAPALWASPSCPEYVADATCRSPLPWTSLPSGKHTDTHTQTHTRY